MKKYAVEVVVSFVFEIQVELPPNGIASDAVHEVHKKADSFELVFKQDNQLNVVASEKHLKTKKTKRI